MARSALARQIIIERFGWFPHRNVLLGHVTIVVEQALLDQGGFSA